MEESFDVVMRATPSQLNGRLWINFVGEKAYDYGGLSRLNLRYFTCCVCNHGNCAELGSLSYSFIIKVHINYLWVFEPLKNCMCMCRE